jgi:hypothetical protein
MTMAEPGVPDRAAVISMLAAYGDRDTGAVVERIDSLGLAWLVHQVEQRYGVSLDLDDKDLSRMDTVGGAVEVLRAAMPKPAGNGNGDGNGNGEEPDA